MSTNVTAILSELYELDPALKEHEAQLLPLLTMLLQKKPKVDVNEAFVEKLRVMLRERAAVQHPTSAFNLSSLFPAFGGLALGLLLAVPITYSVLQNGSSVITEDGGSIAPFFSYGIQNAAPNAFGDLKTVSIAGGQGGGGVMNADRSQSGGGGGNPVPSMDSKMMIDPAQPMVRFAYSYEGELPALADQVEVFKRESSSMTVGIDRLLSNFDAGVIDLQKFQNARVDNIALSQQSQFGYMIQLMLREGNISINQNWEQWPHPEQNCKDDACYRNYRTKISDIPADDAVIAIANKFLQDYGISTEGFGDAMVEKLWMADYERATNKDDAWVPDAVHVIYPQLVDGKTVYDESGMPMGISVNVNVRHKRVSDVWGLQNQQFSRSSYAGVTDPQVVKDFITKLDTYTLPEGMQEKVIPMKLGTPMQSLSLMYKFEGNTAMQLMVPSLMFPVEDNPEAPYMGRRYVTVPLAADLMETNMGGPVMPLMR